MKAAVRYSRGRLEYTASLRYAAFALWADSPDGQSVLAQIAADLTFAPFGRLRAARRRVWRHLRRAARTERVVVALQREVDAYLSRLDTLVHAHELPRAGVDLRRLVVVPRTFVNSETYRGIEEALAAEGVFTLLDWGKPVRDWFISTLIDDIEIAVTGARPSPRRPVPAGDGWITVGVNDQFEWFSPLAGRVWHGHYYVLELARWPITRAVRKAVGEAILQFEASLPSLSRVRRNEILNRAWLSLQELFARA